MWEKYWNMTIAHTAKKSKVSPEDWRAIHEAERAWAEVVKEFLEQHGFVLQPETVARLL